MPNPDNQRDQIHQATAPTEKTKSSYYNPEGITPETWWAHFGNQGKDRSNEKLGPRPERILTINRKEWGPVKIACLKATGNVYPESLVYNIGMGSIFTNSIRQDKGGVWIDNHSDETLSPDLQTAVQMFFDKVDNAT